MLKKYIFLFGFWMLVSLPQAKAQNAKWEAYWQALSAQSVDAVKALNLEGMALNHLPEELYAYRQVELIILDNNLFTTLPEGLKRFPKLKKLSIRRNLLHGNRLNVWYLKQLTLLDAGGNKLDKQLMVRTNKRLQKLLLDGMGIQQLKIAGRLPKEIDLSSSRLQKLQSNPLRRPKVEVLVLHSNGLNALPDGVGKMKNLRKLVLGNNGFEQIPSGMARMKKLESLMFYKNRLTNLPDFVWQMEGLTEIDVHHNRLAELPNEIGRLTKLNELYLANNCLRSLPDSLGKLTSLRFLYVENNELETLPSSLSGMQSLERLSLLGNRFLVFPAILNQMPWLQELDISENDIEAFPADFDQWKALKLLLLHENACKNGMACMLELMRLEDKLSSNETRLAY